MHIQLLLDLPQYFQNRYLLQLFCLCILKYIFILKFLMTVYLLNKNIFFYFSK